MRKDLPESINCLLRVYATREDLQTAFPEVKNAGDMRRLVTWAIEAGSSVDSASAVIAPVVGALKAFSTESDFLYDVQIVCGCLDEPKGTIWDKLKKKYIANEPKGTIWDNSKEQYIANGQKLYWETLNQVAKYQFECVTGDPSRDILSYVFDQIKGHFKRDNLSCAILGCDEMGRPELGFEATQKFLTIDVYDIAKGLLAKQSKKLEAENVDHIQYRYADFNTVDFGNRTFDVLFSWGTIHHVENLEHLFAEMNRVLAFDGLFFLRDFVGPKHIQFTDTQLRLTNALLGLLPNSHKKTPANIPKKQVCSTPLETVMQIDPSEAVSSHRINETLAAHFDVVESKATGGTLLHPLLHEIAWNFEKDEQGAELLTNLIELERTLLEKHSIPSDYAFFVAKKKMDSR